MELDSVGILLTYQCPIACRHCYISCGPHRKTVIDLDLAERLLRQIKEIGLTGMNVHIGGGEAFLHFDRLLEVLEIAARLDMLPIDWVETNCFWCVSDRVARERLSALKDAGVYRIWISSDPHHQEFVPIENVIRAHTHSLEIFGLARTTVSDNNYLADPARSNDLDAYVNSAPPMLMGRAYQCLRQYLPRQPLAEIPRQGCGDRIDPREMEYVHVNPDGTVMASNCSGVIIGDARDATLADLHGGDAWRQNDILRVLADDGPVGLLGIAPGFTPKATYAQKCELCWEIRSSLASTYPQTLGPRECYQPPRGH